MVFFQLNVTGLLFQSFRTASPMTMTRTCNGLCFVSLTDVLSKHQIF